MPLLLLSLLGCEDNFDPDLANLSRNLVVMSDLQAGETPSLDIKSTVLFGELNSADSPQDANVIVTTDDGDLFSLRYDAVANSYINLQETIRENVQYNLTIDLPSSSSNSLTASTIVPHATSLNVNSVKSVEVDEANGKEFFNISTIIDTENLDPDQNYYRLRVFLEEQIRTQNQDGSFSFVTSEDSDYVSCGQGIFVNGLTCSEHFDGFLLDVSSMEQESIELDLVSKTHDPSIDIVASRLFFEFSSLSESTYNFEESITKLIESSESVIGEPVINFSNIENGLGYFGASSTKIDTIIL